MNKKIELGQRVKDKITGFIGIAVARCEYFNGCIQYHVSPPVDKDGNERKDLWIDEAQLEIIDHGVLPKPKPIRLPEGGGFRSHPE